MASGPSAVSKEKAIGRKPSYHFGQAVPNCYGRSWQVPSEFRPPAGPKKLRIGIVLRYGNGQNTATFPEGGRVRRRPTRVADVRLVGDELPFALKNAESRPASRPLKSEGLNRPWPH